MNRAFFALVVLLAVSCKHSERALRTDLTREDLISQDVEATRRLTKLLDRCVRETFDASASDLDQFILPRFIDEDATPTVYPTKEGIRFTTTGYPPSKRVWDGDGVTLRYAALLAAGALRADSPVARLWQGIAPSAANPCVPKKK
jgi:hypothetical protein